MFQDEGIVVFVRPLARIIDDKYTLEKRWEMSGFVMSAQKNMCMIEAKGIS